MKLLVFADVHGKEKSLKQLEKKAKKVDILICAGDFTIFEENMQKILRRLNSFGKRMLLIHGNHEEPRNVKRMIKNLKNISYIHKATYRIKDYVFVGQGGEGFALTSKDFEKFAGKLKFKKNDIIILINHQPPHKTRLDYIWDHHGNKSYKKFIIKHKPVLAVCGHLHETAGLEDKVGKTRVINPGGKGIIIQI